MNLSTTLSWDQILLRWGWPALIFLGVSLMLWVLALSVSRRMGLVDSARRRFLLSVLVALLLAYGAIHFILLDGLFGAGISQSLKSVFGFLSDPLLVNGNTRISFATIFLTIPVFYIAARLGSWAKTILEKSLAGRHGGRDKRLFGVSSFIKYAVMTLIILFGLEILGIDLSSIGLFFSILGVGLGFGLQDIVKNFFAGLVIIFSQPLKEGDFVLVNQVQGQVKQVRLLTTVISMGANDFFIVPNAELVYKSVHNFTAIDSKSLVVLTVTVAHDTSLETVVGLLNRIGIECPYRFAEQEINVWTASLDPAGVKMELVFWIGDLTQKKAAESWGYTRIWADFRREGIGFAAMPAP